MLPPTTRDLSIVIDAETTDETIGDQVRGELRERVDDVESIAVMARTSWADLPQRARDRLGLNERQVNALVRVVLRPLAQTLTDQETNELRNRIYVAIHRGAHQELA